MNRLKSVKRIMQSEFMTKFTVMNVLVLAGVVLVAGLPSFFASNFATRPIGAIMSQMLGSVGTYLLLMSLFLTYRDRSSLDKNRAAYLNYSKHEVAFSKLLADISLFIVGLAFGIIMTVSTIVIKKENATLAPADVTKMFVWFFGLIFFYSFTMVGFKLILAAKMSKMASAISIISWLLLTVGSFLVMSIVSLVVEDIKTFVDGNKWLTASLPILNFMMASTVLRPDFEWYYIIPSIAETIIFIGLMWKTTVNNLKVYFCV